MIFILVYILILHQIWPKLINQGYYLEVTYYHLIQWLGLRYGISLMLKLSQRSDINTSYWIFSFARCLHLFLYQILVGFLMIVCHRPRICRTAVSKAFGISFNFELMSLFYHLRYTKYGQVIKLYYYFCTLELSY